MEMKGLKRLQITFEKLVFDSGAFSKLTKMRTVRKMETVHSHLFQQLQLLEKQLDLSDVQTLVQNSESESGLLPSFEEDEAVNFWTSLSLPEVRIEFPRYFLPFAHALSFCRKIFLFVSYFPL